MSTTKPIDSPFWEIRTDGNGVKRAYLVVEALAVAPGGVEKWSTNASGALSDLPLLGSYNSVTLASPGLPVLVAKGSQTGLTAASGTNLTYTVGSSDGTFFIMPFVYVSASSNHSFSATLSYTDEGNTFRNGVVLDLDAPGSQYATLVANAVGAVPYAGRSFLFRAKAGTTITAQTTAGGTYTSVTYNYRNYLYQVE